MLLVDGILAIQRGYAMSKPEPLAVSGSKTGPQNFLPACLTKCVVTFGTVLLAASTGCFRKS